MPVDCRKKSFDEFRIIIVDPNPELDSEESNTYSSYFGISSENSIKWSYIQDGVNSYFKELVIN